MLTHPLRRVIAACASVLLVLGLVGLATSPTQADVIQGEVSGEVENMERHSVAEVAVRFYRATADSESPWTLEATVRTDRDGRYEASLPLGTYRATFNELDDGGIAWDAWTSSTTAIDFPEGPMEQFTLSESDPYRSISGQLDYKGGLITGHVSDDLGNNATPAVLAYDATSSPGDPSFGTPSLGVNVDSNGIYKIHALGGPTKLRFAGGTAYFGGSYESEWYDDASTIESATAITVPAGESSAGHDAVVHYLPRPRVTGRVVDPDGKPLAGIHITYFEAPTNGGTSWGTLNGGDSYHDGYGNHPELEGTFDKTLDQGTYKVGFNVGASLTAGSPFWKPTFVTADALNDAAPFALVNGDERDLGDITMEYAGGSVSGRVTDIFGNPVVGAQVVSTDVSGEYSVPLSTVTDGNGTYTAHVSSGPTQIVVRATTGYFANALVSGSSNPADATEFLLPPSEHITGADVVLRSGPIASTTTPTVSGTMAVGKTLRTTGGSWVPSNVTKTYQWYYLKSGTIRTISGATKSYIGLHSTDYGKRFRVRVTASYPGVASKVVTSAWSRPLLRNSSVSISGSSPSRGKVKLYATVDASGAKATGRVRFTCATPAAVFASKTVTLSSEKASATFYNLPKSKMTCRASYAGTSTIKSSSRSKTIYVK